MPVANSTPGVRSQQSCLCVANFQIHHLIES
jgi:hypothetical protein